MKKMPSKVAHNHPRPFYFTVQPRPQPTAQNWFFILWNLGTRHLSSYLCHSSYKAVLLYLGILSIAFFFQTKIHGKISTYAKNCQKSKQLFKNFFKIFLTCQTFFLIYSSWNWQVSFQQCSVFNSVFKYRLYSLYFIL